MDTSLFNLIINLLFLGFASGTIISLTILYRSIRRKNLLALLILYCLFFIDVIVSIVIYLVFPNGRDLAGYNVAFFPFVERVGHFLMFPIQLINVLICPFIFPKSRIRVRFDTFFRRIFWGVNGGILLFYLIVFIVFPDIETIKTPLKSIPVRMVDYLIFLYILVQLFLRKNPGAAPLYGQLRRTLLWGLTISLPVLLLEDTLSVIRREMIIFYAGPLLFLFLNITAMIYSFRFFAIHIAARDPQIRFDAFCRDYQLSMREQDVISHLLNGQKYKEIADKLCISQDTVKTHVSRIYRKTDCRGKMELKAKLLSFRV